MYLNEKVNMIAGKLADVKERDRAHGTNYEGSLLEETRSRLLTVKVNAGDMSNGRGFFNFFGEVVIP